MKVFLLFLKALIMNPRATGAVFPSSRHLANAMAASIALPEDGLVVELGAGTGVITDAILRSGVEPKRIIAIEFSSDLAKKLRERFPEIEVIEGDAVKLMDLLKNKSQSIDAIVSGLPLRSFSKEIRQAILSQIPNILSRQGRYIQFTYDMRRDRNYYPDDYVLLQSSIVWRNIPPAKVEVFTLKGLIQ